VKIRVKSSFVHFEKKRDIEREFPERVSQNEQMSS